MIDIENLDLDVFSDSNMSDISGFDLGSLNELDNPTPATPTTTPTTTTIQPETTQAPSEYIIPGTGIGSQTEAIKTPDLDLYKTYQGDGLSKQYDLGKTTLESSPTDTSFVGKLLQGYQTLLGKTYNQGIEIATKIRAKAYEGGQDIYRGDVLKGIGKSVGASVETFASPFEAVINETGAVGQDLGLLGSVPFVAIQAPVSAGFQSLGMDKEDADNYSSGLAMGVLYFGGKGKSKENLKKEKFVEESLKGEMPVEIKQRLNKDRLVLHPDRIMTPEGKVRADQLFKDHTNAYLNFEKTRDKKYIQEMDNIVKEGNKIRAKDRIKSRMNKRGSVDFSVFMKDEKNVQAYNNIKEQVKNDIKYNKANESIGSIIDGHLFAFFPSNPEIQLLLQDKIEKDIYKDIGITPPEKIKEEISESDKTNLINQIETEFKKNNPESLKEMSSFLNETANDFNIEGIQDYIGAIEQQIKFLEQSSVGKEAGFINTYGKEVSTALANLYTNNTRANITQATLDKYSDIATNYPIPTAKIEELIAQRFKDEENTKTAQEIYDEYFDLKSKPSTRVQPAKLPKIETKNIKEVDINLSKKDLYSEKELVNAEKDLGGLNDFQKTKAILGVKDTIKDYKKFTTIRNLQNSSLLVYKGLDKANPKLMKFEFTPLAKEYFNVGKDTDLGFLKVGVHYPKELYDQVASKVKQLKKNPPKKKKPTTSEKIKKTIKGQVKDKKTTENDIQKKQDSVLAPGQQKKLLPTAEELRKLGRTKALAKKITTLIKQQKQPTSTDIANLLNKTSIELFQQATDFAVKKGMMTKAEGDIMTKALETKLPKTTNAPTGRLSGDQGKQIIDMLGWQSLSKRSEEFKVNIDQVSKSLGNIDARLHLVNPPEGKRVKLPFTLMGNKSSTYNQILLPMIKKGIDKGAIRFVEPFGGAGTSYYFADKMFAHGLEEMHINHFDNEKYEVVKAIKDGVGGEVQQKQLTEADIIQEGGFKNEFKGSSEVMEAIDDIGGIDGVEKQTVNIKDLTPTEKFNINSEGIDRVIKEVESGKRVPLVVDYGEVIDGNHRYFAYKHLGIEEVPIITQKNFESIPKKQKFNVDKEVYESFNTIIDAVAEELAKVPEVKSIMDQYDVKPGTKGFKDMAEIFFYPQYAKQFFEERPDTKLGIKGELSSTFKEWITEHTAKETGLTGEQLETVVEGILSDTSLFENKYPEISKNISTILDKFENLELKPGDYKTAMLIATAKHFRQRGDSGQKVVSASGGFQSVINVREKMIEGLTVYQKTFDKHGDKINIYNEDGEKFISKMGENFNDLKTLFYGDPPYVRTTGTYVKQNPGAKNALANYADPTKVDKIFEPMKDSMMMFTNDIDGKYFESLDRMLGDRMSKDIIGYREGTTPTSLVTSTELQVKPKDVNLSYYQIIKDQFIKNMFKALKESLLPKIAKQLEKPLAKFQKAFMVEMNKKFGDIEKFQGQVFKGKEVYEKIESSLSEVVSGKDKQAILSEAKKWVKQNKVTGAELVKLIDKINRLWVSRENKIREFRAELSKTLKSDKVYAETKKEIQEWFSENYTEKKVTGPDREAVDIVDKFATDVALTPAEWEIYEKYLNDEKFNAKVERARKESIYNLDIDQIQNLTDQLKKQATEGKDTITYREKQEQQLVDKHVRTGAKTVKFVGEKPADINYKSKEKSITEEEYKSQDEAKAGFIKNVKDLFSDKTPKEIKDKLEMSIIPVHWILDEKMGVSRMVYDVIEQGRTDFQTQANGIMEAYTKLNKELKLNKKSFTKLALHGLARRSDKNGIPKLVYELLITGVDPATGIKVSTYGDIQFLIGKYKEKGYLTTKEQKMYDFMQNTFTELGKQTHEVALDIDNLFVEMMEEYFPIKSNLKDNTQSYGNPDTDLGGSLTNGLFKKVETEAGFLKKATGVKMRPELNADFIFRSNVYKVTYYNHMQRPIRTLSRVKNQMIDSLGNLGYKYLTDYIDRLARQGIVGAITPGGRLIAHQTRNVSKTFVSANPASYMVQFSALLEGKAVGANINPIVVKNAFKNKKMIFEKSRILKTRDYTHVHGYEGLYKSIVDEITDKTMLPMAIVDKHVGMIIWYSIYKQSLRLGKDEVTAIYEADQGVKKTIADPSFFGKSQYHVENERGWGSLTTMYNTFTSNLFGSTVYAGGRFAKSKYGNFARMYQILFALVGGFIVMNITQDIWRRLRGAKKYPEEVNVKIRDYMIGLIPQLGSLYGWNKYGGVGSLAGFNDIVKGILEGDTRVFLHGLGLSGGIPGSHTIYKIEQARLQRQKDKDKKRDKKKKGGSIEDLDLSDIDFDTSFDTSFDLEDLNLEDFNF